MNSNKRFGFDTSDLRLETIGIQKHYRFAHNSQQYSGFAFSVFEHFPHIVIMQIKTIVNILKQDVLTIVTYAN